jgi:hypothetical protein
MTSGDFDSVDTLDDAFARYTVSVGEPVLSRSYVLDDIGIATWYKVRVSETLSQNLCSNALRAVHSRCLIHRLTFSR